MKITKKIVALACIIAAATSVTASADWNFAGYDTTNPYSYGKIYNEVIDGSYTSKSKIDKLPSESVEWKFEGYELQFPHVGYERLYLEGNAQSNITRTTNAFPQWETQFKDYMWEVSGEHRIYQRQQTKINNSYWAWDFGKNAYDESMVLVPTTRNAEVTEEFRDYTIANLDINGNYVFDVNGAVYNEEKFALCNDFGAMPTPFNVELDAEGVPTKQIVYGDFLHDTNLSQLDADGQYVVTDEMIANYIDIVSSKFVTGPSYYGENPTKNVASMYYANRGAGWTWDWDTVRIEHSAAISWTTPIYEMTEPYKYYQYLVVNGLVLDGRNDTPRVWRYTGGKANPDVEWKYAFVEADYPFNVVEFKYIRDNDGKMVQAYDAAGQAVYRFPSGEFGNGYIKVTDAEIQYYVKDEKGETLVDSISRVDSDFGGGYAGYVGAGNVVAGN